MGFNCLKDTQTLQGDGSFFTFSSTGVPGIHFIKLKRMKAESTLEPHSSNSPFTKGGGGAGGGGIEFLSFGNKE